MASVMEAEYFPLAMYGVSCFAIVVVGSVLNRIRIGRRNKLDEYADLPDLTVRTPLRTSASTDGKTLRRSLSAESNDSIEDTALFDVPLGTPKAHEYLAVRLSAIDDADEIPGVISGGAGDKLKDVALAGVRVVKPADKRA